MNKIKSLLTILAVASFSTAATAITTLTTAVGGAGIDGNLIDGAAYDADGDATNGVIVLDTSDTYLLVNNTYVTGLELVIEPGVTIFGSADDPATAGVIDPGALIVTRTGSIIASGTPDAPIIFTYEDDVTGVAGDAPTLGDGTPLRALWGGLILLGNAPIDFPDGAFDDSMPPVLISPPGFQPIEGLVTPPGDQRGIFGGQLPNDNSGIVRYVSLRHGGFELGEASEINGLTMGGIGYGTTIEFVEVYCNVDDGFEWFGGTVFTNNLISAFNTDDSFDYDEGFLGLGQFWFSVGLENALVETTALGGGIRSGSNRGGEHDGATGGGELPLPTSLPTVYNATYVGNANSLDDIGAEGNILEIRDNAGGFYFNSIFTQFFDGIDIEDLGSTTTDDSRARLENEIEFPVAGSFVAAPQLFLNNNVFWNFNDDFGIAPNPAGYTPTNTWEALFEGDAFSVALLHGFGEGTLVADGGTVTENAIINPFFLPVGALDGARTASGSAIPVKPAPAPQNTTILAPYSGTFFNPVGYKGAFNPSFAAAPWLNGWTAIDKYVP